MSYKSFVKKRIALSLAVLMTLTCVNVTGFAKTVRNLENQEDLVRGEDYVNVTLNPGTGNIVGWVEATESDATESDASSSDATESDATESDATSGYAEASTFTFQLEADPDGAFRLNKSVIEDIVDKYELIFINDAAEDYGRNDNLVWLTKSGDLSSKITEEDVEITKNTTLYAGCLMHGTIVMN